MNWKRFDVERPKARIADYQILVWSEKRGPFVVTVYNDGLIRLDAVDITHWAEIEGPGLIIENAIPESFQEAVKDFHRGKTVDMDVALDQPPPKPDPFEEAFKEAWECLWDINDHYAEIKSAGRLIWDAAMKYKEGK